MREKLKILFRDGWLYLPIFVMSIYFLYRLVDQSQLLFYFPRDYVNDISSYMAQLFFLRECGFLNFCQYWYNGFISFSFTPPGWFLFALPFYYLFGDVKIATYFTMVLSFVLAFLVIYFGGKRFRLSKLQRVAFFSFMFMNALSIGSFIRLGRVHELFTWVWFLLFSFLILYYRERKLDWKSLFIIPSYSLILLSYLSIAVISSLLFLGLFIIKPKKEKILVAFYFLASSLLTSFWFVPFIKSVFVSSAIPALTQNLWLWQFRSDLILTNLAAFLFPLAFLILFYYYWSSNNKPRNEIYFFAPVVILGILYLFRLTPFIPVFRNIFPDPYLPFFLFFSLFFFFKIDYSKIDIKVVKILPFALVFLALISITINILHTPSFVVKNDKANLELEGLFSKFNGSFLMFGDYPRTIYAKAIYSYVPIYYGLSTPYGWYPELKEPSYFDTFKNLKKSDLSDCGSFIHDIKFLNTTHVIGYRETCGKFSKCNLNFLENSGNFCLYKV